MSHYDNAREGSLLSLVFIAAWMLVVGIALFGGWLNLG